MRQPPKTAASLALLVSALAFVASFGPTAPAAAAGPAPGVTISHANDYVARGGTLDVSAVVALPQPAAVTTVRFRVLSTKGKLLYQHTESRYKLPTGAHSVRFERTTSALGLKEGTYRLEVRVESSGSDPTTVSEPVLVVNDKRVPVPVAIVVRVRALPLVGADGALDSDPASSTSTIARDEAVAAASLHEVRPDIPFTLAIPPVTLDDWRRAARGPDPEEGGAEASQQDTVSADYRRASQALAEAARDGLTFAGMPYAEPDVGALDSIDALEDLGSQMRLGSQVTSSTLHTSTPGAILDGGPLRREALAQLATQGVGWVLVSPSTLPQSGGATPTPGAYAMQGTEMAALVIDERASVLLTDPSKTRIDLLEHLYRRASSDRDRSRPVVAVIEVGGETTATVADLQARLAALQRVSWVRLVTLPQAAELRGADTLGLVSARPTPDAAGRDYWERLAAARTRAFALHASADPGDADGDACVRGITLAEHRLWAGPLREAGEVRVRAADALAMSFLGGLSLESPDVTLSGNRGKVRVSVTNRSDKVLTLIVESSPRDLRVLQDERVAISVPPGETLLAIPVEVRSSLKGTLGLRLLADTFEVATSSSAVTAGFLDRLVIVGGVAVILLALLWYIRSRGRAAASGGPERGSAEELQSCEQPGGPS